MGISLTILILTLQLQLAQLQIELLGLQIADVTSPKIALYEPVSDLVQNDTRQDKTPLGANSSVENAKIEAENELTSGIWGGYPELKIICACESNWKPYSEPSQFRNGRPLYSHTFDVGACQISIIHWEYAENLGLDIFYSKEDNVTFAKMLYDKNQSRDWRASQKCHGF